MTPKEKAKELVERFDEYALIAVNEIIESEPRYPSDVDWDDCGGTHQYYYEEQREEAKKYWEEVIKEIKKL